MGDIDDLACSEKGNKDLIDLIERRHPAVTHNGVSYELSFLKDGKMAVYTDGLEEFNLFGGRHDDVGGVFGVCGTAYATVRDGGRWCVVGLDGKEFFGGKHDLVWGVFGVCGNAYTKVQDSGKLSVVGLDGGEFFGGKHDNIMNVFGVCGTAYATVQDYYEWHYVDLNGSEVNLCDIWAYDYVCGLKDLGVYDSCRLVFNVLDSFVPDWEKKDIFLRLHDIVENCFRRYGSDSDKLSRSLGSAFRAIRNEFTLRRDKYQDCAVVPNE